MRIIALMSQKGGAGKTTLAVHLATAAASVGIKTALIDLDPQGSVVAWSSIRAAQGATLSNLDIGQATVSQLGKLRSTKYDLIVLDTPPHATVEAASIARAADHVVIPCRPSVLDLAAISATVAIVRASERSATIVLSSCPPRGSEVDETREALASYGIPVAPVAIIERRAYARALATGRAVHEFEPKGKAAEEINELLRFLDIKI